MCSGRIPAAAWRIALSGGALFANGNKYALAYPEEGPQTTSILIIGAVAKERHAQAWGMTIVMSMIMLLGIGVNTITGGRWQISCGMSSVFTLVRKRIPRTRTYTDTSKSPPRISHWASWMQRCTCRPYIHVAKSWPRHAAGSWGHNAGRRRGMYATLFGGPRG